MILDSDIKLRRISVIYALPLVLIFFTVLYVSERSIEETTRTIAQNFVDTAERVIAGVEIENQTNLLYPEDCRRIQQNLRYERDIEELQIVSANQVYCSSIRSDNPNPLIRPEALSEEIVYIYSLPVEGMGESIVVVTRSNEDERYMAMALVDRDYMRATVGYRNDRRVKSAVLIINGQATTSDDTLAVTNPSFMASSSLYGFEVFVEASDQLVEEKRVFYALVSIPVSMAVLLVMVVSRFLLKRNRSMFFQLKQALIRREFVLHYQPQVDASTLEVKGVEALVRWQHPEKGMLYPDVFIPLMEEFGLINGLTDYVIDASLNDLSSIQLPEGFHLGLNVPPSYFKAPAHWVYLQKKHREFAAKGIRLGLEVTERQFLDKEARIAMEAMRQEGIEILLDDFGTGQTSLSVLQESKIDFLKIDKCFVDSIGHESVNTPVLNAIINLGNLLGVTMVAEGVENEIQANYLFERGVVLQQGYYYSKPKEIGDIDFRLCTKPDLISASV